MGTVNLDTVQSIFLSLYIGIGILVTVGLVICIEADIKRIRGGR